MHVVSKLYSETYFLPSCSLEARSLNQRALLSTAIIPTRPSPKHHRPLAPRRSPFDVLVVGEGAFPLVTVENAVVTGCETLLGLALALVVILTGGGVAILTGGGITMLVAVAVAVPVAVPDAVTVEVTFPVEEMEDEVTVEVGPIGIKVVNERGGDGVTEGRVAVIVAVLPPGSVVVRVITSVRLDEEAAEVSDVPEDEPMC
ncbi:hypothetical protein BT96DRAFT_517994 [Gymnopus androsaceus JB14]|uniref:Uncharacterized protein n=1 Tax=Gymnopus androsaceus JB14 TaxID=1447944 RepID=A0A6A4I179_9AGAR|nr:hypothetical protein BT96DRAFT_517994 [Gymnopus androsaceus JB14]